MKYEISQQAWKTLSKIPFSPDDEDLITQRDINDLMIAESDYLKYSIENELYNEHEHNLYM